MVFIVFATNKRRCGFQESNSQPQNSRVTPDTTATQAKTLPSHPLYHILKLRFVALNQFK